MRSELRPSTAPRAAGRTATPAQPAFTAVLFATAGAEEGAAAALPWEDTSLAGRLLGQLAELGAAEAHVITRPAWTARLEPAVGDPGLDVRVHASDDLCGDMRAVASIAAAGEGPLVIANADVLAQREALAVLVADARVATGILVSRWRASRFAAFGTHSRRDLVLNAGTAYHHVADATERFLGVMKVAAGHRGDLQEVAGELARKLEGGLPDGWRRASELKARGWRSALHRRDADGFERSSEDDGPSDGDVELVGADEAELRRRIAAAREDATALLLRGLVKARVPVATGRLRGLFWARPLSHEDLVRASSHMAAHDEERALLNSAVKASDGFFTTFLVSPYSKYVARWAARHGFTPNAVTTLSMAVGILAAVAFATGGRAGMIAGAVLLQAAFTLDCVDGQLARYTRTFSGFGAWLDSMFDRGKEYAVYAGLAIGAARTGDDVWLLAGAALALQTARHAADFGFNTARDEAIRAILRQPLYKRADSLKASADASFDGASGGRWLRKMLAFPIGERFAAISLTAALFGARTTFVVLLTWGAAAAVYTGIGRISRSLGASSETGVTAAADGAGGSLTEYRDDGPVARAAGRLVGGAARMPPVALVGAAAVPLLVAVAVAGADASWSVVAAAIAWAVVSAGASAGRPLRGRLRWAVPPLLRVIELAGILWVAAVAGATAAGFALLCAIAFRHYDIAYRFARRGATPPRRLAVLGGGWDGRLLAATALGAAGASRAGFYAGAAALAVLSAGDAASYWTSRRGAERSWQPEDDDAG